MDAMDEDKEVLTLDVAGVTLTTTGLVVEGEPDLDDWEHVGSFINRVGAAVNFWCGDYLNYAQDRDDWAERYEQIRSEFNLEEHTLANIQSVCRNIRHSRRRENLPWSHHAEVAYLEESVADELLEQADPGAPNEQPKLTIREMRAAKNGEDIDAVNTVAADTAKALRLLANLVETLASLGIDCEEHTKAIKGVLS